jgi:hypothetical protein
VRAWHASDRPCAPFLQLTVLQLTVLQLTGLQLTGLQLTVCSSPFAAHRLHLSLRTFRSSAHPSPSSQPALSLSNDPSAACCCCCCADLKVEGGEGILDRPTPDTCYGDLKRDPEFRSALRELSPAKCGLLLDLDAIQASIGGADAGRGWHECREVQLQHVSRLMEAARAVSKRRTEELAAQLGPGAPALDLSAAAAALALQAAGEPTAVLLVAGALDAIMLRDDLLTWAAVMQAVRDLESACDVADADDGAAARRRINHQPEFRCGRHAGMQAWVSAHWAHSARARTWHAPARAPAPAHGTVIRLI